MNGNLVEIKAGKNLDVIGSQVVGSSDVTLKAGENINIAAGEESYQSSNYSETTKSGFLSSGGLGISYGTEKETDNYTSQQKNYSGSTIGSTGGNVSITSGKDISVAASDIISKNDIAITGENVSIASNDVVTKSQDKYKYQKTGLTLAITGTASDIYDAAKALDQAQKKNNKTQTALQAIKLQLALANAALDSQLTSSSGQKQASIGVSAMVGTQITERETNQEQHTAMGSGISAGQNITIKATGNGSKESGDITLKGSEIRAGNDTSLEANHDLNVIAALNTQGSDSNEQSYGGAVGVQAQVGGDEAGFRIKGSANYSSEKERANGSTWSESVINAGNHLTVKTGNDTNIIGGQLNGESVKMDVGNNLNVQSLQDTDGLNYDKTSGSVSVTGGYGGYSANLSASYTGMDSNWASVTDQAGIFAGNGGYDITVGNNTDLKGAVIASTATDTANNKLDTGTISFSDIENKGDFKVNSVSASIGVSTTGVTAGAPSVYHDDDSKNSTTKSAIENGTLTVRNKDNQKQDVDTLSHDTAKANDSLAQFFDKQKELDTIETVGLVKDIAGQIKSIGTKADRIKAQNELEKDEKTSKENTIKEAKDNYKNLSAKDKEKYDTAENYANNVYYEKVSTQVASNQEKGNNSGGMGSNLNKGIDAAASIATGVITGDIAGGLAGASAPYLAGVIKNSTDEDSAERYIAHGILGAGVAALQGNSALAGAAGAVGGEFAAKEINEHFYGGKDAKDLTESEKESISNWSQIASGLTVGAVSGGNIGDAGTAVSASKNAVENNSLMGDYLREENKKSADLLKDKMRSEIGKNAASVIVNGVITAVTEGMDSSIAVGDTAFDVLALLTTCSAGASYCEQAKADYAKINSTISNTVNAITSGDVWNNVNQMLNDAWDGDQKSQENTVALIATLLSPSKSISNFGKGSNLANKVDNVINKINTLDDTAINKILATEKGKRPDPSSYMTKTEIEAHLAKFDDGAVRFTSRNNVDKHGTYGSNDAFVMPALEFDKIMIESKGNLAIVEQKLGLEKGYLSNSDTMAVYIKKEDFSGLKIPSGNEGGANQYWKPGGKTSGGLSEAVMDLSQKPKVEIIDLNNYKK